VADIGQGWYGFNLSPEDFAERVRRLEKLLAANGRKRAEVQISVSPYTQEMNPARLEAYRRAGADQVILIALARDRAGSERAREARQQYLRRREARDSTHRIHRAGRVACPVRRTASGRLSGKVVTAPVDDWAFASGEETLQLETRPDDPYSVNVWFVASGPRLWVACVGGDTSGWGENMIADPRVRLRIDGKLYERKAVRVTEQSEIDEVVVLYKTKYDYKRDAEDEGKAVLFRMDPR
jgi:hypothetical protein